MIIFSDYFIKKNWGSYIKIAACALINFMIVVATVHGAEDVKQDNSKVFVSLMGFNYTNRFIDSYSVDDSGGGHVGMSSPTAGGSGTMCCAIIDKSTKEKILVKVRWQVDGCTYLVRNSSGELDKVRHKFHKEKFVYLEPTSLANPRYLETHFFPDGTIKLQITEDISLPKLKLSDERPDQSKFPRCENDKEPI